MSEQLVIYGGAEIVGAIEFSSASLASQIYAYGVSYDPTTGQLAYMSTASFGSGSGGAGSPGGSSTQIQYNDGGAFNGVPTLTYSGGTLRGTGSFTGSFAGSLTGTASYANNADSLDGIDSSRFATTGSNTFRADQTISGSLTVTSSLNVFGNEFIVNSTGVKIGNAIGDTHTITGSLNVSGSITASLSGTASFATNALTASYANNADLLDGIDSTRFATTGSNNFIGTQTINSGSLSVYSGSLTVSSQNIFNIQNALVDDFERVVLSPGGTPSTTYTTGSTVGTGIISLVSNYLNISNNASSGSTFVTYPIPTINTTLTNNTSSIEWEVKARTNRTTVFSGFNAGSYGGAIILAGTETNPSSSIGIGYALTYGGEASPNWRSWRLVRFSSSFANVTTVVSPNTHSFANPENYVSLKVTYNPTNDLWTLYSRDDGASSWSSLPITNDNIIGSAVNTTYASTPLPYGGFYYTHATAANQNLQFDNLSIKTNTPTNASLFNIDSNTGLSFNSGGFTIDNNNIARLSGSLIVTNIISGSIFAPSITTNLATQATAYTASISDYTLQFTGNVTASLYSVVGNRGRQLVIKNGGTGVITVDPVGSETIDGQLTRRLAARETLLLQSDGVSDWLILNKTPVVMLFYHDSTGISLAANTTYYIGQLEGADPTTTSTLATRRAIALSSGWITRVTRMCSVASTLSGAEDSTLQIRNVTTNTTVTISSTIEFNAASQLEDFTLATPLQVTRGDVLTMIVTTGNWITVPNSVRQTFNVLIE